MTSAPPTSPLPQQPPRPGEPLDPELRERYRTDAQQSGRARRAEEVRLAAQPRRSRTPVGPIRAIALIITALLVAGVGLSMVGPMLKQSETIERPLTAQGKLQLRGHTGDVRIRAVEPGESPRVVMTRTWGLREPSSSVTSGNGETRLDSTCSGPAVVTVCRVDWLVVVPAGTDLDIEQGVGALEIDGMSGDVAATLGVGDVRMTEAESQRVTIDLGVGQLSYEAVEPPRTVDLAAGVGDVHVRVPDTVPYRVEATPGAASVSNTIGSTPSADRRIIVESGVGSVSIDPS